MPRPCYHRLPLLMALLSAVNAHAQQVVAPEAVAGVLVLSNGNVLQGKIQREGDVYRVERATSQLQVRVDQVDLFCHTIDEAYEQRRLQRVGTSPDSHVELARWCLRHNLLEYASRELLEARAMDSEHRQLAVMERQLQLALRNREAKNRTSATVETAAQPSEDHEQAVADVPDWARTLFVRQIQPLIVNSCAASGCHQSNSQEPFHINRLAIDGPGHPATTLANLAATLEQLDFHTPENSRLLVHAQAVHGAKAGAPKPEPLAPHQFHMLRTWVEQVALAKRTGVTQHVALAAHTAIPPAAESVILTTFPATATRDPFDPMEFNQRAASVSEQTSPAPTFLPESVETTRAPGFHPEFE